MSCCCSQCVQKVWEWNLITKVVAISKRAIFHHRRNKKENLNTRVLKRILRHRHDNKHCILILFWNKQYKIYDPTYQNYFPNQSLKLFQVFCLAYATKLLTVFFCDLSRTVRFGSIAPRRFVLANWRIYKYTKFD